MTTPGRTAPPLPVFRSPVRGPWLTSVLAAVLLVAMPVVIATGLLSYAAYEPRFGTAMPAHPGPLRLPFFAWPAHPVWLYRLNQGLHVGLGLALVPVVLGKLWSVLPKLFVWPPARTVAEALERLTVGLLVGGVLFEMATGVLNVQYDYVFGFDFYTGHYYGAWIFLGAFVVHVALKLPVMLRSLRGRSLGQELRTSTGATVPEPRDPDALVCPDPAPATISRRGVLGVVGAGSVLVAGLHVGDTSDALRSTALLSVRSRTGDAGFPVNRTAAAAGTLDTTDWVLQVSGPTPLALTREQLLALPQTSVELPISCVEGWSTSQRWAGVRLADLAARAGLPAPSSAVVTSLERHGAFARAVLGGEHVATGLLALRVNGQDLHPDHGFPARVVAPALPGVHCTKWVARIELLA